MTLVVTEILPEALQLEWRVDAFAVRPGNAVGRDLPDERRPFVCPASHQAGHSFDDCQGPLVPIRE